MQNRAIICTHHKTGTIWMRQTFETVAAALDVPCVRFQEGGSDDPLPASPCFIRDVHSRWFVKGQHTSGDRVIHVIRDPRDVVISAMHYHRKSEEKWLHRPDNRFGGKTYQQTLNELPHDKARMIFEMDYSAGSSIRSMCAWRYDRQDCFETKYETLLGDGGDEMAKAANHIGLGISEAAVAVSSLMKNSLIAGARHKVGSETHIRSGSAKQWPTVYDADLVEAFRDRFPEAIAQLGYEHF